MAKAAAVEVEVQPSTSEAVGRGLAEVLDAEPGVIRGFRAAREPELIEARRAHNAERRSALSAKFLAELNS